MQLARSEHTGGAASSRLRGAGDRADFLRAQVEARGGDVLLDVFRGTGTGNRQDLRRPPQQPGQRHLVRAHSVAPGGVEDGLALVGPDYQVAGRRAVIGALNSGYAALTGAGHRGTGDGL
jgi:hypothetical protein